MRKYIYFILVVLFAFSAKSHATTFYTQGDSDFSDLTNWNSNIGGGGSSPVFADLLSGTHDFVIQAGHAIVSDTNLVLNSITIEGSVVYGNDNVPDTITVNNDYTLSVGASAEASNAVNAVHVLKLNGNLAINDASIDFRKASSRAVNIEFNGNFSITGTPTSQVFNSINFVSGTRTATYGLNIDGNVIIETAGRFAASTFTHTVAGNWTENGSGAMTYGVGGTIIFDGSIVQTVPNTAIFNNLTISGGGIVAGAGRVIINGDYLLTNNSTQSIASRLDFYGDFTVDAGSTYDQTNQLSYFGANTKDQNITCDGDVSFYSPYFYNGTGNGFVKNISGAFTSRSTCFVQSNATVGGSPTITMSNYRQDGLCNWSGDITFTGGTQYTGTNSPFILGNASITIDGNCNIQANDSMVVNNDVTIKENRYWILNQNSALIAGSAGRSFTQEDNSSLYLRGTNVFPENFDTYALSELSWQRYDRNYKQFIEGDLEYGRLILSGGDSSIAEGPITVNYDLYVYSGVDFNLGNFDHHFKRNIYTQSNMSLISSGGTVYFDGDENQTINNTTAPGIYDLNNVVVTDAISSDRIVYFRVNEFNVKGDFRVVNPSGVSGGDDLIVQHENSSRYIYNDGGDSLVFGPNTAYYTNADSTLKEIVESFDGTSFDINSTVYFYSTANQWIPSLTYGNLWIRGGNQICLGPLDINGNFSNRTGTPNFDDGGFTHTIAGNYDVNRAGTDDGILTGTFIFDGIDQTIETQSYFNNVIFNNSGTLYTSRIQYVADSFVVKNGSTYQTDETMFLEEGHLLVEDGGVLTQSNGWMWFRGTTQTQEIRLTPASSVFGVLNYKDGVGTDTLLALSDLNVESTFRIGYNSPSVREGAFDLNGFTVNIGQHWEMYPNARFIHNNGTIHMNGSSVIQYMYNNNPATEYFNLVFSGSAEKVFDRNPFRINGDVTINNTVLNGTNRPHYVLGDWINIGGTWQHSNELHFDGVNQFISQSQFWTVLFEGTGTKTLTGAIDVNGGLRIDDNVTLDVGLGNNNINLQYWWDNDSTGTFEPRNGTVTLDGTVQSSIYSGGIAVGKQFYNLTIDKADPADRGRSYYNDVYVQNDLVINQGRYRTEAQDLYIGGSFINDGEYENVSALSSLEFVGTSGTHQIKPAVGGLNRYRTIHFNAPGATYELTAPLEMVSGYGIIIDDGYFDLNSNSLTTLSNAGDITINSGTLEIDSAASLNLGDNATLLNAGGDLLVVGTELGEATIQKSQANNYIFEQTGGNLAVKYFNIKNTSGNGIDVQNGTLASTNAFSNGTFSGGSGNAYITIGATVDLSSIDTAVAVVFNDGPTYNVSRTSGIGEMVFKNPSGALNGEANDQDDADPGTLIKWDYPDAFYWDGGAGTSNWSDNLNWTSDIVPPAESFVFLEHTVGGVAGAYTVNINSSTAICYNLTIDDESSNPITLNVNGADLEVGNNVSISSGSTLSHINSSDTIRVAGSWNNSGSFNEGTGTVIFNGTTGTHSISTSGALDPFYDLKFDAPGAIYVLGTILGVDGTFMLDSGIVDVGASANNIFASGDWSVRSGGTFEPNTAIVYFDNTGDQLIDGGTFYNLSTTGSGTKTLNRGITIEGRLHIEVGTVLDAQTNNITVNGNWRNDVGNAGFLQTGVGGVIFSSDDNQIIGETAGTETTFNNVYIQGNAVKQVYENMNVNGSIYMSASYYIYPGAQVVGTPSGSFNQTSSTLIAYGISPNTNFPVDFGTYNITGGAVQYRGDGDQDIYPTDYFRLNLFSNSAGVASIRTATGDFSVSENLYVNDDETTINMAGFKLDLTGTWSHQAGAPQPTWNGGTLNHVGANWNMDPDLTDYHNLILGGTGTKGFNANSTVSGDLTIQAGVTCDMNTSTVTSTGVGKTMLLSSNSTLRSDVIAANGDAFPLNFSTYDIDINSITALYGASDQTVYSGVTYGTFLMYTTGNATLTGDLDVDGNFLMNGNATFIDGNFDMNFAGANTDIRDYTPGTGTMTFDGDDQALNNGQGYLPFLTPDVVFTNSGTKTLHNDIYDFNGNVTISPNVTVTSYRPVYVQGNFTNNGTFTHTGNVVYFDGITGTQTVNPGVNNDFYAVEFEDGSGGSGNTVNFTSNGIDVFNGTFVIDPDVTVNMGTLTHTIASSTITNNGTWVTNNADLTFDRLGGQTIPGLTAKDIVINGSGTKTLLGDWFIDDLTINTGTALDVNNSGDYSISLTGNWNNTGGGFNDREGTVFFESNSSATKTILSNGQWFYKLKFNQADNSNREFNLLDETYINDSLVVGNNATFSMNANTLHVGNDDGGDPIGEVIVVQAGGVLDVDAGGTLLMNVRDNGDHAQIIVEGTLQLVGSSSQQATLGGEQWNQNRKQINLDITTGTIAARYYSISELNDNGLQIRATANIDATHNLSDGSFSNMRTAGGTNKYYMRLECNPPPSTIDNVTFNYGGTPVVGETFNVWRPDGSTTTITFDGIISGTLGGVLYEHDLTEENTGTSRIDWPAVSEVNWTGAVSTAWEDPQNWSPAIVPDSSINAVIPLQTNNPIIDVNVAKCRDLILSDGILTVDAGYNLEVFNDLELGQGTSTAIIAVGDPTSEIFVSGNWTKTANAIFSHGNGTVHLNGAAGTSTLAPRNSAFYNLDIATGGTVNYDEVAGVDLYIEGDFTISSGIFAQNDNWHGIHFQGNVDGSGGTFDNSRAGYHYLDANANQSVQNVSFYRLEVEGSGIKTVSDTLIVAERTNVYAGVTLASDATGYIEMNNNVDLQSGSTFDDGGATHVFKGGYWYGEGNFVANTGTIVFDRNNIMYVEPGKFNNWEVKNRTRLLDDVTMTGDLTIYDAVRNFDFETQAFNVNNTTGTGTFEIGAGERIRVEGAESYPNNFSNYIADPTSQSYYQGTVNQTVRSAQYGRLYFSENNVKTLDGDIDVEENIYIYDNSTLDVSASNFDITIAGYFFNHYLGEFICRNGNVTFDGTTRNTGVYVVNGGGLQKNFYDLTVNNDPAYYVFPGVDGPIIENDFTVTNGLFNANGMDILVGGSLQATGGTFGTGYTGNYMLNKTAGVANIRMNGSVLYNLDVIGGATYTMQDDLSIRNNLKINSGVVNGNGNTVSINTFGRVFDIGGTYIAGAGGRIQLANASSINVNLGGLLDVVGSPTSNAVVSNITGRYSITINGTIKAENYKFEFMDVPGVRITNTGTIDNTNHFSNGTFDNCPTSGACLVVDNTQSFTGVTNRIENVNFPSVPGGSAANVSKTFVTTGVLEFYDATGNFSGEDFDDDPSNIINWTGTPILNWVGVTSTDWFTVSNWKATVGPDKVPDADDFAYINASAPFQPTIAVGAAEAKILEIETGAALTLDAPVSDSDTDLFVSGFLTNNGIFQMVNANDTFMLGGSWNQGGTGSFSSGNGTVILVPASGSASIDITDPFYNLIVNATSTSSITTDVTVNNDFEVVTGIVDLGNSNNELDVKGNFINNGTIVSNSLSSVILSGSSGSLNFKPGMGDFANLNIEGGADYSLLTDNLTVKNGMFITGGSLVVNGLDVNLGDCTGTDQLVISTSGELSMLANSALIMGSSSSVSVNSGGTIKLLGTDQTNRAVVTRSCTGNYGFTVNSGGTIHALYTLFEYMNSSGINLTSGSAVDLTNNFSFTTFQNGVNSSPKFTYNAPQDLTGVNRVLLARFLDSPSGSARNVRRNNSGVGQIEFKFAQGPLSGEDYEFDPFNKVFWEAEVVWTGNVNDDYEELGNWQDGIAGETFGPDQFTDVLIPDVAPNPFPIVSNTSTGNLGQANLITIEANASITVNSGINLSANDSIINSGTITLNGGGSVLSTNGALVNSGTISMIGDSLNVDSAITNSGTLTLGDNSITTIGSSLTNTGTINAGAGSNVIFTAPTGSPVITLGTSSLCGLTIASASPSTATFLTGSALDIDCDLNITSGVLEVDNATHIISLAGNFNNTAGGTSFEPGDGTVIFNGSSDQSILNESSFNNVTIANTGVAIVRPNAANDLNVDGDFTINADGEFNVNNKDIYIGGDWTNNEGADGFNQGTRAVFFDGPANQNINGFETFYNLVINNSGGEVLPQTNIDVDNDFRIDDNSGSAVFNLGANTMNIGGNWLNELGTAGFVEGTSTVIFDASSLTKFIATADAKETFFNLTINSTGGAIIRPSASTNIDVDGDFIISPTGIFNVDVFNIDMEVAGQWTNNNGAAGFVQGAGTETVTFDGAVDQTVTSTAATEQFNNLIVANTGFSSLFSDASTLFDIDGDITINVLSQFRPEDKEFTIAGNWTNNNGGPGFTHSSPSVAIFDGTTTQTIFAGGNQTFQDLRIATSGGGKVVTSATNLTIQRSLVISSTGVLDAETGNTDIQINNDWINNNADGFIEGTDNESVIFMTDGTITNTAALVEGFNNLSIASGTRTPSANLVLDIAKDLTIFGTLNVATNSNDIFIGGDWLAAGGFLQGTQTVTFDGSAGQTISSFTGNETYYNLAINNSGNVVSINTPLIVENKTTFSSAGYINLNGNDFTIENWDDDDVDGIAGTTDRFFIVDNSSYVKTTGVDAGETVTLPMGLATGSANYARADIAHNSGVVTTIDVNLCDYLSDMGGCSGGTEITEDVVDYYWDIVSSSTDADVTLYWDQSKELTGFDRTMSRMSRYDAGGPWEYIDGATGAATVYSGTVWSFTGTTDHFTGHAIGNDGGPLPIELLSFTAQKSGDDVQVDWITAAEISNERFKVQRSQDGAVYENVVDVLSKASNGTSTSVLRYDAIDENPFSGTSYYRLVQIDLDGTESVYGPIAVDMTKGASSADRGIRVFPNPNNGRNFTLMNTGTFNSSEDLEFMITDVEGRKVFTSIIKTDANGDFVTYINPADVLPAGVYVIRVANETNVFSTRLIVDQ